MVNHHVSPTNENIGVHAVEAAVVVVEKMFQLGKGKGRKNGKGNGSGKEIENRVEKMREWSVKLRTWTFHQVILRQLPNLSHLVHMIDPLPQGPVLLATGTPRS